MSALSIQWIETKKENSEVTKNHIEMLSELLRDVKLEKRMETLIKAEVMLKEEDFSSEILESIRGDLEMDLILVRKMIFLVEQAQYYSES